ncbi:P-loop NTPase family protein [Georgenia subflava]|uniref:AAA family ATPase n=1 Tax=Georgenia subflava TaxID=1622177 RepID=A0A6N7ELD5_9MICO|nr:AAA family ATPase [Georgenia subflava]MPV38870.1 AAA family ATPase [Georgenia subflava]
MRTLGPTDPLPIVPRRIAVVGTAGVGKTTLAERLATRLQLPHVEIDGLHWGPAWTPRPDFLADVEAFVRTERWVTEWQYTAARPLIADRAELMVWLDLPVPVRMVRVLRRTVRRRLRRESLWAAGNIEPPLRTVLHDREHIVRWAWDTRHKFDDLPARLAARSPHVVLVRLRSQADVDAWLTGLRT